MSVEAPKTVEETAPVESKPVEQSVPAPAVATEAPTGTDAPKTETSETADGAPAPATTEETKPVEETLKKDETVVEAVPASEGTLGYKAPGFLKQFHFSKQFFWFSEEPLSADALASYSRSEKSSVAQNAAWARETGKGVLFFSKRAEDKAHPTGVIPLYEAIGVTKDGMHSFSFDIQGKTHKFEAASSAERDSWVVAVEKQHEESKALKEEITGRDSYKKNFDDYSKPIAAVPAAVASRSKSKEANKSLDANTATAVAADTPATAEPKADETPLTATSGAVAPVEEKKDATKERSQSRKRTSIFGSFLKKDDAKEEKKAEEKAEKQEKQEEKKVEAEVKKEEATQEHDASKAAEAAAAAAVAAAPTAIISADKPEEKVALESEAPATQTTAAPATEGTSTTATSEKKAKRGSVFGSLFNKAKITSPTAEKSEKEVGPTPSAKDDVPPITDTAPKLDEPIDTKPLDTAAVTAPANTDGAAEAPKESTRPNLAEAKGEKKSFLGFINKKPETKKEEAKDDKGTEAKPTEPTATDALVTTEATDSAVKSDSETPAEEKKAPAEKEKRRTSIFGGLGTIKKKKDESEPIENGTERKREKSPLPSKIGGLFRKPSKAVKSEESKPAAETKDEVNTDAPAAPDASIDSAIAPTSEAKTDVPATTDVTDSKIVGDVVPEALTTQDKVATAPEVKASA